MIWQLNNQLHYTGDYISKINEYISDDKYPEQDLTKVNKFIYLGYKNEKTNYMDRRLYIASNTHPYFIGISAEGINGFKILRFDVAEPFVAIMVNLFNDIIVADCRDIKKLNVYPDYQYGKFGGLNEAYLQMSRSWDDFNESYKNDKINLIAIQNNYFLGKPVYVEFFNNLLTKTSSYNKLERTYVGNKDIRYNEDLLNVPFRAHNQGYIIRSDENGDQANIVVMVTDEESGKNRYYLGSEAFYYYDTESINKKVEEFDLWHAQ